MSDRIAASKAAAPAIPIGKMSQTSIGSGEWSDAAPLAAVCTEAGYVSKTESWTGG